jgi:hypothetical protein
LFFRRFFNYFPYKIDQISLPDSSKFEKDISMEDNLISNNFYISIISDSLLSSRI